jgi:MoaA/NifB/PqqE/SkfB family radical SAM enzyme
MPYEMVEKTLNLFGTTGIDDFRLTGGEPTLHPRFESIVKSIAERGHRVRLISNGKRLYQSGSAKRLLALVDVCWISAYGTTPERHARVAGVGALPLHELERWVGELTADGFRIGLSVLLSPGDSGHVNELLESTFAAGVRRLRLLPLEPDGRAASTPTALWVGWPTELQVIYELLKVGGKTAQFEVLTLNDPFDFGDRFVHGQDSCLLRSRRMWSVVPNGDIYSCCFNVYQPAHRVANVEDLTVGDFLSKWTLRAPEHPCRAFEDGYWQGARPKRATCPISSLSVLSSKPLPTVQE